MGTRSFCSALLHFKEEDTFHLQDLASEAVMCPQQHWETFVTVLVILLRPPSASLWLEVPEVLKYLLWWMSSEGALIGQERSCPYIQLGNLKPFRSHIGLPPCVCFSDSDLVLASIQEKILSKSNQALFILLSADKRCPNITSPLELIKETMNCICLDVSSSPPPIVQWSCRKWKGREKQERVEMEKINLNVLRYERWGVGKQSPLCSLCVWCMITWGGKHRGVGCGEWGLEARGTGMDVLLTHERLPSLEKTCEGPLHAYFTLSSQACMKHDKRLFAVWPTSPPQEGRRVYIYIFFCNALCWSTA